MIKSYCHSDMLNQHSFLGLGNGGGAFRTRGPPATAAAAESDRPVQRSTPEISGCVL